MAPVVDQQRAALRELRAWYRRERRALPWREAPTPYRVWVSEVMLQQTQAATVAPYFERWMRRFPDLAALAAAPTAAVLEVWQGLGYYSRARALHAASRQLVASGAGGVPAGVAELRRLPGVGAYTAGAIASIAFGAREPAVDGNVERVLTRWWGLAGDPRRAPLRGQLWELARRLVASGAPGELNQALMELGARLCRPRNPVCAACPLAAYCRAHAVREECRYPERGPRAASREVAMAAVVVGHGERVLVVRAPPTAQWWTGLWHFPYAAVGLGERPVAAATRAAAAACEGVVGDLTGFLELRHQVTRHRIVLHVFRGVVAGEEAPGRRRRGLAWRRPGELEALGMPAPHRRVARALLAPPGTEFRA